jgi:hypothetical protein
MARKPNRYTNGDNSELFCKAMQDAATLLSRPGIIIIQTEAVDNAGVVQSDMGRAGILTVIRDLILGSATLPMVSVIEPQRPGDHVSFVVTITEGHGPVSPLTIRLALRSELSPLDDRHLGPPIAIG